MYSCDQCSYPSSEPESEYSVENDTIDAHQPTQNSDDQQVTNPATLEPRFPGVSHDSLPRTSPLGQSPGRSLPIFSDAATPVILGPSSENVDRPTNEWPCRERDTMLQKNVDRIERTVNQREHLDKTAVPVGDDSGARASSSQVVVEVRTNPGFFEPTIASSCSKTSTATLGSIAVSSTDQIPLCVDASPGGCDWSEIQDLYTEIDGFSKGPHTFKIGDYSIEWNALVPNIVICCTESILEIRGM